MNNLAGVYGNLGQNKEAEQMYRSALEFDLANPILHLNLGVFLADRGRDREAVSEFTAALKLNPSMVAASVGKANALARQGEIQEAASCLLKAVSRAPNHAVLHYNLGVIFEGCGRLSEARAFYENAFQIDPAYEKAKKSLRNLAEILE